MALEATVMKRMPHRKGKRHAKTILRLPDLDIAKAAVINSLSCPDAQRGYSHAIDEFVDWYCSEPRLSFSRTVVVRYRMHLESRELAPGTINLRLGATRADQVWPGFFPLTGPMTKMVLPDGSSRSNVRAPHSSSRGARRTVTFALHSR